MFILQDGATLSNVRTKLCSEKSTEVLIIV
jgi:hypothetical protein